MDLNKRLDGGDMLVDKCSISLVTNALWKFDEWISKITMF